MVSSHDILVLCIYLSYIDYPPPTRWVSERNRYKVILLLALLLNIMKPISILPFGLGRFGDYFLFFIVGFFMETGYLSFPKTSKRNLMIASIIFLLSFFLFMVIRSVIQDCDSFFYQKSGGFLKNICLTLDALTAIYLIYAFANFEKVKKFISDKDFLITISSYCYGVYIYHQFILLLLYHHTKLPNLISVYYLPWIASIITVTISVFLCHFTLKTKFGKYLIG